MDNMQKELVEKKTKSLDRSTFLQRPLITTNVVIDDDELLMEYTMTGKEIPDSMNFMIVGENKAVVYCRSKIIGRFRKLMEHYAASLGLPSHALVFSYKNVRFYGNDSPLSINMLEGESIEVRQREITSFTVAPDVVD